MADGRILFLVPARGGSRRVPGKNLRTVGGVRLWPGRSASRTPRPRSSRAGRTSSCAAPTTGRSPPRPPPRAPRSSSGRARWPRTRRPRWTSRSTPSARSTTRCGPSRRSSSSSRRPRSRTRPTSSLRSSASRRSGHAGVTSVVATHPAGWHHALHADGVLHGTIPVADGLDVLLAGAFYVVAPDALGSSRRFVEPGRDPRAGDRARPGDRRGRGARRSWSPRRSSPRPAALAPAPVTPVAPGAAPASAPEAAVVVPSASPGTGRRRVTVLTTGRQDWGILESTCAAIRAHPDLELDLLAGGMHLSPRHGHTVDEIRADGFEPAAELAWLPVDASLPDPPAAVQAAAPSRRWATISPRAGATPSSSPATGSTAAAALAATVESRPDRPPPRRRADARAFDDALRHSITKLAHLHLVSNDEHARRVLAMGEDPATVVVVRVAPASTRSTGRTCRVATSSGRPGAPTRCAGRHRHRPPGDARGRPGRRSARGRRGDQPGPAHLRRRRSRTRARAPTVRAAARATGRRRAASPSTPSDRSTCVGLLRIADAMLGNTQARGGAGTIGCRSVDVGDRQASRTDQAPRRRRAQRTPSGSAPRCASAWPGLARRCRLSRTRTRGRPYRARRAVVAASHPFPAAQGADRGSHHDRMGGDWHPRDVQVREEDRRHRAGPGQLARAHGARPGRLRQFDVRSRLRPGGITTLTRTSCSRSGSAAARGGRRHADRPS